MVKQITNNIKLLFYTLESVLLFLISFIVKRDPNCIAIGSWIGERYADNSKYLAKYIVENYDYKVYWVGNRRIQREIELDEPSIVFLEKDRFRTNLKLLSCKYFFCTQEIERDISSCNVYRKAVSCYLHHGMPIKKWHLDAIMTNPIREKGKAECIFDSIRNVMRKICGRDHKYDYFVTSSNLHENSYLTALKDWGFSIDKSVRSGTPRNDMLVNYNKERTARLKKYYSSILDFSEDKKVILYLPTFRRISQNVFSFSKLDFDKRTYLEEILKKNNAVLIEKSHFAERVVFNGNNSEYIKFLNRNVDVQEMLMFTDVLISDYSGAYLDYLLLDRPIVHFAYDYEYYRDVDSGLYYSIDDFAAGDVVISFDELCISLLNIFNGDENNKEKREYVKNKYMSYEKGKASEIIVNRVITNT